MRELQSTQKTGPAQLEKKWRQTHIRIISADFGSDVNIKAKSGSKLRAVEQNQVTFTAVAVVGVGLDRSYSIVC